ncbi:MAG: PLP-dependent aminotransferase family protein [Halanaerobiales bacterium]
MFGLKVNRNSDLSLTRQLCDQLRDIIEKKQINGGERLPSTRQMSREYKVSRNVIIEVYEQLIAEGYLESKLGSGTYVSENIYDNEFIERNRSGYSEERLIVENQIDEDIIHFAGGIPDFELFPGKQWSNYLKMAVEDSPSVIFDYGDIMGDYELKKVLTEYLFRVKGIRCNPDQIIIVSGSAQGFLLISRVFEDKYNSICVEEPTVNFIKTIFKNLYYDINPVNVDQNGMQIDELIKDNTPRLILLTPSHQYPTGSILPIQRRQKAIEIAETTDSYLIEDDYDSEFRLKGVPIPPLQVLNPSRVVYVSTFSKNMSPGLRMGFLVVPKDLLDKFYDMKTALYLRTSTIKQRAMANFINDGHLDRQIYQMRKEYKKRRSLLAETLIEIFREDISIKGDETGMHLHLEFHSEKYNSINWDQSNSYGVQVHTFNEYSISKQENFNKHLVLGYGNLSTSQIKEGIKRLELFIKDKL